MAEFGDQKIAVAVAEAIFDALMDDGNQDDSGSAHSEEVQRRWHGDPDDALEADSEAGHGSTGEEDLESTQPAAISHRDLLHGVFRGSINRRSADSPQARSADSPPAGDPADA